MAYRKNIGRKIEVEANPKSARALIRRHLREEGMTIANDLALAWDMHRNSAYRWMYDSRPLRPGHIDAVVELLKLDEFDAQELYVRAAIESGWKIRGPEIL